MTHKNSKKKKKGEKFFLMITNLPEQKVLHLENKLFKRTNIF